MPAYIIVEINIHDPKGYEEYKKLAPASLAAFGGEFLIPGGKTETWKAIGHRNELLE